LALVIKYFGVDELVLDVSNVVNKPVKRPNPEDIGVVEVVYIEEIGGRVEESGLRVCLEVVV
jgi:hypothetical protein